MRPSETTTTARRQIEHWLLMIVRMLVLAVACLAFAEPLLETEGLQGGSQTPPTEHLIVLDTSMSMGRQGSGGSPIDRARAAARTIVGSLDPSARAAIVTAAAEISLLAPLTSDRAALRAAIGRVEPRSTSLSMDGLLDRLTALGEVLGTTDSLEIHLVSDFQASSFPARFDPTSDARLRAVSLVEVAGGTANWAITDIRVAHAPTGATGMAELLVTLEGFATPAADLVVTVLEDGREIGRDVVSLQAEGRATIGFESPAPDRSTVWEARLTPPTADALPMDDVRRMAYVTPGLTSLPLLGGDDRARAYVDAALTAAAPRFNAAPLEDDHADIPPDVNVMLLLDGPLTTSERRLAQRHLDDGGGALIVVGPALRSSRDHPLLGALEVQNALEGDVARGVVVDDPSHPGLGNAAGWRNVEVFRSVAPKSRGNVVLSLDDGTPLLSEHRRGAGTLLVLATHLDPAWSSLVVEPVFVEFLAAALGYLAADTLPAEALAGVPFTIPAEAVQVFDAEGRRALDLASTRSRPTVTLSDLGVYEIRTPAVSQRFAVNAEPIESRLDPAPPDVLRRWQTSLARAKSMPGETAEPAATTAWLPLAPWLLALLATLLIVEPLLAGGFRRRARPV